MGRGAWAWGALAALGVACGGGGGASGSDDDETVDTSADTNAATGDDDRDDEGGGRKTPGDTRDDDGDVTPAPDPNGFVSTLPPLAPGEPFDAEPNTWTWVDVPDARCQADDPTGMSVNLGDPTKIAILMEGGGACYNAPTCTLSLAIHPLGAQAADTAAINSVYGSNIFNRDDASNPLRDWTFVFFPYCSGDVFAGASRAGSGYEGRTQQGYYNVQAYLRRLIATFPDAAKVLLTGVSAGGFGAAFNYDQVQEAFGQHTRVYLLDDSGPPLPPAQMTPCLQERWREAWSLDDIMPPESACPACRNARTDVGVMGMTEYLAKKYPGRRLAVISAMHDAIIRTFFGYGLDDCKDLDPVVGIPGTGPQVPPEEYEKGLEELFEYAQSIEGGAQLRGFLVPDSETHTFLISPGTLTSTVVDGVALGEWLRQLVEDDPAWDNVGIH